MPPGGLVTGIECDRLLEECDGFRVPALSAPANVGEAHQRRHEQRVALEHGLQRAVRLGEVASTPLQVGGLEHVEAQLQRIEPARLLQHFERFAPSGDALEKDRGQSFVAAREVRREFESPPEIRVGCCDVEIEVQVASLDIGLTAVAGPARALR